MLRKKQSNRCILFCIHLLNTRGPIFVQLCIECDESKHRYSDISVCVTFGCLILNFIFKIGDASPDRNHRSFEIWDKKEFDDVQNPARGTLTKIKTQIGHHGL